MLEPEVRSAAREMELRFMRIGVDIDSLVERDMMRMQAVFQDRRSLVFGISISGSKEEVLFLLKEAYRKGAKRFFLRRTTGVASSSSAQKLF